jgi:hypothetical protein
MGSRQWAAPQTKASLNELDIAHYNLKTSEESLLSGGLMGLFLMKHFVTPLLVIRERFVIGEC